MHQKIVKTCGLMSLLSLFGLAGQMANAQPNVTESHVIEAPKLATWNVEHLALPSERGCKPRNETDIKQLRAYAESVDADIFALQEVSSQQAVEQIFPPSHWQVVLSARPASSQYECRGSGNTSTQQRVAFAVKKSIPVLSHVNYDDLASDIEGLRYGLSISIDSPQGRVELLNVHLKSGCFVDDYRNSDKSSCEIFAKQARWLDDWVENKQRKKEAFVVLGDFNHRASAPYNQLTRLLTNDSEPSSPVFVTRDIIGCHPRYPAPIDHILVGGIHPQGMTESVKVHPFSDMSAEGMLSDHCAISASLTDITYELPRSVKWFRQSKEYQLLTAAIYHQATQTIRDKDVGNAPWAVVMDIDETILDNSEYQQMLAKHGESFSPESWAEWVKSEKAGLVPGVRNFIQAVLDKGGRLALVTNRPKGLDNHTWSNLLALGLPVTRENSCLMGRTEQDKAAIGQAKIRNDKDLRRQQIRGGTASCSNAGDTAHANWLAGHKILMQVGDNIEDIGLVTQEDADPAELLSRWEQDIVILPNPMYGSW